MSLRIPPAGLRPPDLTPSPFALRVDTDRIPVLAGARRSSSTGRSLGQTSSSPSTSTPKTSFWATRASSASSGRTSSTRATSGRGLWAPSLSEVKRRFLSVAELQALLLEGLLEPVGGLGVQLPHVTGSHQRVVDVGEALLKLLDRYARLVSKRGLESPEQSHRVLELSENSLLPVEGGDDRLSQLTLCLLEAR